MQALLRLVPVYEPPLLFRFVTNILFWCYTTFPSCEGKFQVVSSQLYDILSPFRTNFSPRALCTLVHRLDSEFGYGIASRRFARHCRTPSTRSYMNCSCQCDATFDYVTKWAAFHMITLHPLSLSANGTLCSTWIYRVVLSLDNTAIIFCSC